MGPREALTVNARMFDWLVTVRWGDLLVFAQVVRAESAPKASDMTSADRAALPYAENGRKLTVELVRKSIGDGL